MAETTAGVVVLLVGYLSILAYLVAAAHIDRRLAHHYKSIACAERTRSEWAEARLLLFELVRSGKLDVRSETFRTFYGVQTLVMRRPDEYALVSRRLAYALLEGPMKSAHTWAAESQEWPKEMGPVLQKMARGTAMIAFGFPGGRRFLISFLVFKLAPFAALHLSRNAVKRIARTAYGVWPELRAAQRLAAVKHQIDSYNLTITNRPESYAT